MQGRRLCIALVTNNYTPFCGGVVSSVTSFADQLRAQGHDAHIITLDFTGDHNDPPYVHRLFCPVKFRYKQNHLAIPVHMHRQLQSLLAQIMPDIVHVQHPFLLGPAVVRIARERKTPVVFTYHTQYEQYAHYVPLPQRVARLAIQTLVQRFCQMVDGIIVPSQSIKEQLPETCATTRVIPSGILPTYTNRQVPKKSTHKKLNLLTVSRCVPEKNLTFLFDVLARLDPEIFDFTLIGYGPLFEALQQYAYHECGLSAKTVQFIHRPARSVIADWYRKADLFLFSSTSETQGLVLAEAMAGGTPVISVKGPGQNDLVVDGQNGFLVDGGQQMAQKIMWFFERRAELGKMQQHAWQSAQQYTAPVLTQELLAYYRLFFV